MATCKGKISEGYDFPDDLARAVIVVGLPFPSIKDHKIILKKDHYLKPLGRDHQWLVEEAMRTVNQAIGRVIRHIKDHGIIFLLDKRFTYNCYQDKISGWARKELKTHENLDSFSLDKLISEFNETWEPNKPNFYESFFTEAVTSYHTMFEDNSKCSTRDKTSLEKQTQD